MLKNVICITRVIYLFFTSNVWCLQICVFKCSDTLLVPPNYYLDMGEQLFVSTWLDLPASSAGSNLMSLAVSDQTRLVVTQNTVILPSVSSGIPVIL